MPKLPHCDTCRYCAHHWMIVCALHPDGVEGESCKDYEADPDLKNQES